MGTTITVMMVDTNANTRSTNPSTATIAITNINLNTATIGIMGTNRNTDTNGIMGTNLDTIGITNHTADTLTTLHLPMEPITLSTCPKVTVADTTNIKADTTGTEVETTNMVVDTTNMEVETTSTEVDPTITNVFTIEIAFITDTNELYLMSFLY